MKAGLSKLQRVMPFLARLVDGENLSADEAERLIYGIFRYDRYGLYFTTWLAANHAKGETPDELLGFLKATKKLSSEIYFKSHKKTIALSGMGGGSFKSINVSTCAAFIVASAGYIVPNEVYFGVTSNMGSADIFTSFGVDFLTLKKDHVEKTLDDIGICPIMNSFISPKLKNRGLISKKYFVDYKIGVKSPFHLVSNLQTPVDIWHRIYGCYSEEYLETIAHLFVKLEFKRSLTFYAEIGMPEISNVGKTIIVEQNGKKLKRYTVTPEDLGVKEAEEEDIKTGGKEQNIKDFINILRGTETGPKADLVAINAGAALYALGDVKTLKDGTKKAQEILKNGEPYRVFEKLIHKIGDASKLPRT